MSVLLKARLSRIKENQRTALSRRLRQVARGVHLTTRIARGADLVTKMAAPRRLGPQNAPDPNGSTKSANGSMAERLLSNLGGLASVELRRHQPSEDWAAKRELQRGAPNDVWRCHYR